MLNRAKNEQKNPLFWQVFPDVVLLEVEVVKYVTRPVDSAIFQQEDKKLLRDRLSRQAHGPESRRIFSARACKLDHQIAGTPTRWGG